MLQAVLNAPIKMCWKAWLLGMICFTGCQPVVVSKNQPVDPRVVQMSARWSSCLLIAPDHKWKPHIGSELDFNRLPKSVEAGSATPITADGYFLTAAHVLRKNPGGVIHLKYGTQTQWRVARIVWKDEGCDLALIHVPIKTAGYFRWSTVGKKVPRGSSIFHLGTAIGESPKVGHMVSDLKPPSWLSACILFETNVQLQPGDSGGPVLDANGSLLGISSAVKYRMPGMRFLDTEVVRPNVLRIERMTRLDRSR